MFDKTFKLEIITPRKTIFKGEVRSITVPGTMGYFQILFNHAPLMSSVDIGKVKLIDADGKEVYFAISGGFVEVRDNKVVLLAEAIESVEEIDIERAEGARDRAMKRLSEKSPHIDIERARASLNRALNRLSIAQKHK